MARKKYVEEENNRDSRDPNAENNLTKNQKHQKNLGRSVLGNLALKSHAHQHQPRNGLGGGTKLNNNNNSSPRAPEQFPISAAEDNYSSVEKQLQLTGLTIREMPGDGNCLFRALADQLEGHTRNHLDHRRAVVQYMRDNRPDFEPFVEDDEPFEKYVQTLSQPGTFAGNDAIVAFARLHNVTVVIHQLNYPAWLIHPTSTTTTESESQDSSPSRREVHIAYHNGDHYNSVRKIGDESDTPSNIKFFSSSGNKQKSGKTSPPHTQTQASSRHNSHVQNLSMPQLAPSSLVGSHGHGHGHHNSFPFERDEDYWVKDEADIERLVDDVIAQTDYPERNFVRETLIEFNFDMTSTLDFILSIYHLINQSTETQPVSSSATSEKVDKDNEKGTSLEEEEIGSFGSGLGFGLGVSMPMSPPVPVRVAEETGLPRNFDGDDDDENEPKNLTTLTQLKPVNLLDSSSPEVLQNSLDVVNMNEVMLAGSSQTQSQNQVQIGISNVVTNSHVNNQSNPNPKAKLSCRQKKEQKKRERKREADKRKKSNDTENSSPIVILQSLSSTSSLGSLNI